MYPKVLVCVMELQLLSCISFNWSWCTSAAGEHKPTSLHHCSNSSLAGHTHCGGASTITSMITVLCSTLISTLGFSAVFLLYSVFLCILVYHCVYTIHSSVMFGLVKHHTGLVVFLWNITDVLQKASYSVKYHPCFVFPLDCADDLMNHNVLFCSGYCVHLSYDQIHSWIWTP